jgi:hypothetical protein
MKEKFIENKLYLGLLGSALLILTSYIYYPNQLQTKYIPNVTIATAEPGNISDEYILPAQLAPKQKVEIASLNAGRISLLNTDKVFDGEAALDSVMDACRKGAGVVVLDSVGALVPRYVLEHDADKETMAALARLLGRTVNKICSLAAANNTLVIFINQLRINPGAGAFKDPEGYPGGKAIAHACSVILKLNKVNAKDGYRYIEDDDGNQKMIAGSANVFVQKNRFAPPHFGGIRIPIYYENYFPQVEESAFEYGRQTKLITVRNGVFSWGGLKVEGKKAFAAELVAQNKVGELINAIKGAAKQADVVLPAAILNYDKHIAFIEQNKEKLENAKKKAEKQKSKKDELSEILEEEDGVSSETEVEVVENPDV